MTPQPADKANGPLAGIRVLDLTGVVFGAYATQIMGDMGADVIKVEFPGGPRGDGGDIMRWAGRGPAGTTGMGPIFTTINRNKRSWLLDLRRAKDMAQLGAIVPTCDVFVSSVRRDGLARLGLDEPALRALRPDIIYAHATGYGSDGPRAGEPAYDDLIQAASGLADLLPRIDGGPPRYLPTLLADKVAGLFLAQGVLAALFHRQRTGEGQSIEVPMLESVAGFNLVEHLFGEAFDPPTGPWTYPRVATAERRPFPTSDGYIALLPYNDAQWLAFFRLAGASDLLAAEPRFADYASRAMNAGALYALVRELTPARTSAEWLTLLGEAGIPVAPLNRLEELAADAHLAAVGLLPWHEHPRLGRYRAPRSPFRFSATPTGLRRHPPELGEHTAELAAEAEALMRRS